jgi:hypothetical protein
MAGVRDQRLIEEERIDEEEAKVNAEKSCKNVVDQC